MESDKAKYMVIYSCTACGQESGMTEQDAPHCYTCEATESLVELSRREITPEVIEERLRKASDSMFLNLLSAFENMAEEDKKAFPEGSDAEKEMLLLLDKAKKYRDSIHNLELKEPGTDQEETTG